MPFADESARALQAHVLPDVTLAVGQIAVYMRLLRSDMIATLQEDFILMAKSKGISNRRILWRHALRPSSLTLLTVAGLNVGTLIGGAVVIERIFGLPGLGKLIFDAIGARQYVAVQSLVAIIAIGYVLVNFFVDILYTVLDPRIRHAASTGVATDETPSNRRHHGRRRRRAADAIGHAVRGDADEAATRPRRVALDRLARDRRRCRRSSRRSCRSPTRTTINTDIVRKGPFDGSFLGGDGNGQRRVRALHLGRARARCSSASARSCSACSSAARSG